MAKTLKRKALVALCGISIVAGGMALGAAPSSAGTELRALTWEGYTDPSVIEIFTEKTGCSLVPTYVGSNDEITAKMAAGGGGYDVISPAVDNSQLMAGMGVLEPLYPARLKHFNEIYESFRNHPGVQADGKIWAMPMAWGSIPLMYRTDKFDTPPTSAKVLFDPQYKGKIGIQNVKTSMYLTARVMYGADFDVYDMTDVSKFPGTYRKFTAGVALGGGGAALHLKNEHNVILKLSGTTKGLSLDISASGMTVEMRTPPSSTGSVSSRTPR